MENSDITLIIPALSDNSNELIRKLKPGDALTVKSVGGRGSVHTENLGTESSKPIEVSILFADIKKQKLKRERISTVKAKGIRLGRKIKTEVDPAYFDILREEWLRGKLSGKEAAKRLGISPPTFFNRVGHPQGNGVAAAKARGFKFGRKPMERPNSFYSIREAWSNGEITAKEAGRRLGVCGATFKSWALEGVMAAD